MLLYLMYDDLESSGIWKLEVTKKRWSGSQCWW